MCCGVLQWCAAVCCGVTFENLHHEICHCVAVICCSVQCVAVCCSVLRCGFENLHQEMRQCVAVCCSAVLQCVAVLQCDS